MKAEISETERFANAITRNLRIFRQQVTRWKNTGNKSPIYLAEARLISAVKDAYRYHKDKGE